MGFSNFFLKSDTEPSIPSFTKCTRLQGLFVTWWKDTVDVGLLEYGPLNQPDIILAHKI